MTFISPSTKNNYFTKANNYFSTFSNRFFKEREKTVEFCSLTLGQGLSNLNSKYIYPSFYTYDIQTNELTKKYPKQSDVPTLSSLFTLSSFFGDNYNFNLVRIEKPRLTYNSLNDIYKCTYTGVDSNNLFHIFDYEFYVIGDDLTLNGVKYYKHSKNIKTTNFSSNNTLFTDINSLSGAYSINLNEGVLSI